MTTSRTSRKNSSQPKIRRSRAQWQSILDEFDKSGLSMSAFCEQQGLPLSSFFKWRSILKGKPKKTEQVQPAPLFVEISPTQEAHPSSQPDWDMELILGNGVILRMRQS